MLVAPAIGMKRMRGVGVGNRRRGFLRLRELLFLLGLEVRELFLQAPVPVRLFRAKQAITGAEGDDIGDKGIAAIGEDGHPYLLIGQKRDLGHKAVNRATMLNHTMAAICANEPALPVAPVGDLRVLTRWKRFACRDDRVGGMILRQ